MSVDHGDGRAAAAIALQNAQLSTTSVTATSASARASSPAPRWVHAVTKTVAPTTLIAALAFFFGWTRTSAQMYYYGLDPSLLGFTNQDYLLRSVDTLFLPLGVVVLVLLLAAWMHTLAIRPLRSHHRLRQAVRVALIVSGGGVLIMGAMSIARHTPTPSRVPLLEVAPAIGVALIVYSIHLHGDQDESTSGTPSGQAVVMRRGSLASTVAAVFFAVLSLFWATSQYANALGVEQARWFVASLADQPGVDVYSRDRLDLRSGGVLEARIGDADSLYRFRYSGLRLVVHSGDSYYLMPASWSARHGAVIVLHDGGSLRFEYTRGATR